MSMVKATLDHTPETHIRKVPLKVPVVFLNQGWDEELESQAGISPSTRTRKLGRKPVRIQMVGKGLDDSAYAAGASVFSKQNNARPGARDPVFTLIGLPVPFP